MGVVVTQEEIAGNNTLKYENLNYQGTQFGSSLDVSEMTHRDEISDAYQRWQNQRLEELGGRLLITRVRLVGSTEMNSDLHQNHKSLVGDLHGIKMTSSVKYTYLTISTTLGWPNIYS